MPQSLINVMNSEKVHFISDTKYILDKQQSSESKDGWSCEKSIASTWVGLRSWIVLGFIVRTGALRISFSNGGALSKILAYLWINILFVLFRLGLFDFINIFCIGLNILAIFLTASSTFPALRASRSAFRSSRKTFPSLRGALGLNLFGLVTLCQSFRRPFSLAATKPAKTITDKIWDDTFILNYFQDKSDPSESHLIFLRPLQIIKN